MAKYGKYIYCIIRCPDNLTFDAAAIGEEGDPVYTVRHDGIAAVVSDTAAKQYESTRKNMLAHEKVLEAVMKQFALLPVRFGTVADSASAAQDIQTLLTGRADEFRRLLGDMEGKVELGLKAFWRDDKAVFEEVVAEDMSIRRLRDSLTGKPPAATHFDRMRLGEMVKVALERKRAREAGTILLPLRRVAHSLRENAVLLDRMITNAAFLVHRERVSEFDQAVNVMAQQLGDRIAVKYVGPVPPYNFVNIVVNWKGLN